MTEQFSAPESQAPETIGAHVHIAPEQLEAVKSRIAWEIEVLTAQRAFTAAAIALKALTEFVPHHFDQVVECIGSEVELNGRNVAEVEVMATIETEDGTPLVESDEGFSIAAFNPEKPNRVLFSGFDFSNRGTPEYEENGDARGQFWVLADLDNINAKLELYLLPYSDSSVSEEQFTAKLYEQLYAE